MNETSESIPNAKSTTTIKNVVIVKVMNYNVHDIYNFASIYSTYRVYKLRFNGNSCAVECAKVINYDV